MLAIAPPIESEGELVQVLLKMTSFHPTMMCASQPGFEVADDLMYPGQELACTLGGPLDQGLVKNSQDAPIRVSIERHPIGANLATWSYVGGYELPDEVPGEHRQVLHSDAAGMVASVFDGNNDDFLRLGPSTDTAFLDTSDVNVVELDNAVQRLALGVDGRFSETPAHVQGTSVRPDSKLALELKCGDPRRQRAHQVGRPEPMPHREMAILKDRSCGKRDRPATLPALPVSKSNLPTRPAVTLGAGEAIRPADRGEVLQARSFGREPALKLTQRFREHGETLGRAFLSHFPRITP